MPTPLNIEAPARYDYFQIMRGVACAMVFLNHVTGVLSVRLAIKGTWYEPLLTPVGFPWVWLFLILSGFLLTKQFVTGRASLDSKGIKSFYARRCKRLLPMLVFAPLLFGFLYVLGIWSPDLPDFRAINETMIAFAMPWTPYVGSNPVASVNSPVWSAVIEVHYFLLLPLLLLAARRRPLLIPVACGIWGVGIVTLALLVIRTGRPDIFPMIYQQHLYNCGFMLAGCALALFAPRLAIFRGSPFWPVVTTAVAIIAAQYLTAYDPNIALASLPILLLPPFAWLVLSGNEDYQAAVPRQVSDLALARGPLRWIELIGMMSYSIYLLHKPLSYIAIYQLGLDRFVTSLATFAVFTGLTGTLIGPIIVASFILVETKFRGSKSGILPPTPTENGSLLLAWPNDRPRTEKW